MSIATDTIAFAVRRTMHGDLRAETSVAMKAPGRILEISTGKSGKAIVTRASSCLRKEENGWVSSTHELFGDYSTVVTTSTVRATEKAIREQHASALRLIDAHLEAAEAFYVAKAAKEAERDAREKMSNALAPAGGLLSTLLHGA
jgi:hypothetical protein